MFERVPETYCSGRRLSNGPAYHVVHIPCEIVPQQASAPGWLAVCLVLFVPREFLRLFKSFAKIFLNTVQILPNGICA